MIEGRGEPLDIIGILLFRGCQLLCFLFASQCGKPITNFATDDPPLLALVFLHGGLETLDLNQNVSDLIREEKGHRGMTDRSLLDPYTYHIIRPIYALRFQLGAIPDLQSTTAPSRKEVRYPFPGKVMLLFEVYQ